MDATRTIGVGRERSMRKLFIGGIVAMIVLALAACGNEAPDAAADQARMQSDY